MGFKEQYLKVKEWYLRKISIPMVDALLSAKRKPTTKKKVLIVKLDAIGDYVILRNALKEFAEYFKSNGYEAHLLGNELWEPFCLEFDNVFDKCFFVNRLEVTRNPKYRLKHLAPVAEEAYSVVLHAAWHRTYLVDAISRAMGKCDSWVFTGSKFNATDEELAEMNKWHTHFFPLDFSKVEHEMLTAEQALKGACNRIVHINSDFPPVERGFIAKEQKPYICMINGTSQPIKKWANKKWHKVVQYILDNSDYELKIIGDVEDISAAEEVLKGFPRHRVQNLCGKADLLESAEVVSKASAFIGTDTGFMHLALAYHKPTVCLSLMNHIGHFLPYPADKLKKVYIVSSAPEQELQDNTKWKLLQKEWKKYPIEIIEPQQVIDAIAKNLLNNEA